jgi:hypothetical protein
VLESLILVPEATLPVLPEPKGPPPFWLRAQSCAKRAAAPFCWLLVGSCAGLGLQPAECAREGIRVAGCHCRSPKGFRRPFNVATRSFLKYRLRVCAAMYRGYCGNEAAKERE